MTSFAFIAGLIPLMLVSGAGAIGNRTIGTPRQVECSLNHFEF
jgi:multidrug efflux pump subunit AcrB